ncbi:peptidylprolyl isomerase [Sphingomicrobium sp. XHP0239]|uniref:peptidylprolyl isomerase n=1 Tax=Sphingomicrobium maritimum TaxID=3133972 RepID=UPI0031CC5AA6
MFKSFGKTLFAAVALTLVATPAAAQDRGKYRSAMPSLTHAVVPPEIANDPANRVTMTLDNGGIVEIQLRPDAAPLHVHRVQTLVASGFYDGLTFHRVIPGFMAQGGDPTGTGAGNSQLPDLPAEFNRLPHLRGAFAMAREGAPENATEEQKTAAENTANSQFYIMFAPRFGIDGEYTVLGRVVRGMNTVDTVAVGEPPENPTRIVSARLGGPVPAAPMATDAITEASRQD